jgi:ribosomal protein S18 acetylase RimI-like enzyme
MLRLKKAGYREMHKYYAILREDFDKAELAPEFVFQKALFQHTAELVLVVDDTIGVTIAYALVCPKSLYGYGLLWFFAVLPWYRDRGLGTEALKLIHQKYGRLRGLMLGITETPDAETANRRIRFYNNAGYRVVKTGDIKLSGVPMKIMVRQPPSSPDPGPYMHRILPEIYSHLFSEPMVEKLLDIQPLRKRKIL